MCLTERERKQRCPTTNSDINPKDLPNQVGPANAPDCQHYSRPRPSSRILQQFKHGPWSPSTTHRGMSGHLSVLVSDELSPCRSPSIPIFLLPFWPGSAANVTATANVAIRSTSKTESFYHSFSQSFSHVIKHPFQRPQIQPPIQHMFHVLLDGSFFAKGGETQEPEPLRK